MTDPGCYSCIQAIKDKKGSDELIISTAKQIAKEQNRVVGLFRNEYGQLCICTDGEPAINFVTPVM